MQRMILKIVMTFLLIWAPLVFSGPGPLFNIIANGESSGSISITLCLNGNGPLSCQNYTVNNLNLNIKTTIPNNTYLNAGIRINTPGYTLANTQCRPNANEFCLFSVNDQTSTNLLLTPLVPPAPPGVPTNVSATAAGDSSAQVNWTPPVDSPPVANYIITPYSLSETTTLQPTTCPNTPDFCTVNNLTNGLPYTFSVQAQNSGGESGASTPSNQVNPPTWTQSIVDLSAYNQPGFTAVSCTSSDSGGEFCMAIGIDQNSTNFACSYLDQAWSCNTVNDVALFQAVSCVNQNFCMALDYYSAAFLYSGDPPTWGASMPVSGSIPLYSVSCPDTNFCMAVDNNGNAYQYSNEWGSATHVTTGTPLGGVSCPSSMSCTAVGNNGDAYAYNVTSWGAAQPTPTSQPLTSVSCPTNSTDGFCMASGTTDNPGYATAYISTRSNPTWTSTSLSSQAISAGLYSVSCANDQFCMGVIEGSVFNYSGNTPTWDTGNYLAYSTNLAAVSCANANFCMAVDVYGNAYIYTLAS